QVQGLIAHLKRHYGGLEGVIRATKAALGVVEGETAAKFSSELFGKKCPRDALRAMLPALLEGSTTDQRRGGQIAAAMSEAFPDAAIRENYIRVFLTAEHAPLKTLLTKAQQQNHPSALDVLLAEQQRVH